MTSWLQAMLVLALGLSMPVVSDAQTFPVDDSTSQVVGGNVRMRWDQGAPLPGQRPTVSGEITVLVRLNVSAWQGRQARIYMALPAQPAGPVNVSWSTRGRLLPGALRDGERALVYAGPIQTDFIEDTQRLLIRADGGKLVRSEQLKFSFEIDVESP
ncbi:MAG: hypothetical protein ACREPE_04195 [Lysobacter sp.]